MAGGGGDERRPAPPELAESGRGGTAGTARAAAARTRFLAQGAGHATREREFMRGMPYWRKWELGGVRTMAAASDSFPKRMSMYSHASLNAAKKGGTWNRKGADVFMLNTLLFSAACLATWRMESAEWVRTKPAM